MPLGMRLRCSLVVAGLLVVGCGSKKKTAEQEAKPALSDAGNGDAKHARPAALPAPLPRLKPAALANAIPVGATFGMASLAPVENAYWQRIGYELSPLLVGLSRIAPQQSGSDTPVGDRLLFALARRFAGGLSAAALGLPADPLFAYYGVGRVAAFRVELIRPQLTRAVVSKLFKDSAVATRHDGAGGVHTWHVLDADHGLLVAVGHQTLILAIGPEADINAHLAVLTAAPASAAPRDLHKIRAAHGWKPQGVGFVDLEALAKNAAPACRAALAPISASFPSIVMGLREISPTRTLMEAQVSIRNPDLQRAFLGARETALGVTRDLPGRPAFAFGVSGDSKRLAAELEKGWLAKLRAVAASCRPGEVEPEPKKPPALPPPWNGLLGGVVVVYDADWQGILPGKLEGYAIVTSKNTAAVAKELAKIPDGTVASPKIQRRRNVVTLSGGAKGRAALAKALDPANKPDVKAPPLAMILRIDVGRLLRRASSPSDEPITDPLEEAGLNEAMGRLFGAYSFSIDIRGAGLGIQMSMDFEAKQSPAMKARKPDPKNATARACAAILSAAWTAVKPAAIELGVKDLRGVGKVYRTGFGSTVFIRKCIALSPQQRDCLRAAANPVEGVLSCAINKSRKFSDRLVLQTLLPRFGDNEVEKAMHPALPPARAKAILRRAAGTWTHKSSYGRLRTWRIRSSGKLVITDVDTNDPDAKPEVTRGTLVLARAGRARIMDGEGGYEPRGFLLAGKRLFTGRNGAYPITDRKRFVLEVSGGYVAFANGKCTAINEVGAMRPATCSFRKRKGVEEFVVAGSMPCDRDLHQTCKIDTTFTVVGGHFVARSLFESAMKRKR